MENKNNNNKSITIRGLLLIAFIVLKLCRVIEWSWVWVLSPIWIPLALTGIIVAVVAIWKNR